LTVTDDDGLTDTATVSITVHNPTSSDGGGGCFIGTVANGSQMAFHGKVLRELRSRFAMVNWKWQMSEHESLLNLHYNHP